MHDLIVAPFLDNHLLMRPGHTAGAKIPRRRYDELAQAPDNAPVPGWLIDTAAQVFDLDLTDRTEGLLDLLE